MDASLLHRDLYSPTRIGGIAVNNRVVMAPLTRLRADKRGIVSDMTGLYYAQRASAGLIVSEAIAVSPWAHGYAWTPGIYRDDQIKAWNRVVRVVHRNGGRIVAQLWHGGRIAHPSLMPHHDRPLAPSAIRPAGHAHTYHGNQDFVTPRALKTREVPRIVAEFAHAAEAAMEAGFDGVEIHAANGYLIDQFLRDKSNKRIDAYGGSIAARCKFALDVTEAVCNMIGPDYVGVRISPLNVFNDVSDRHPRVLFRYLVSALSDLNISYLHVIEDVPHQDIEAETAFNLDELRPLFHGAYMVNGGYDARRAEVSIESGRADFVSFGRAYIANPDLVERFIAHAPLEEPEQSLYYAGGAHGYIDYPAMDARH
ncbi:MAG: alkene reductase [Sphingomonadales bacterium]|jgi:N-ethylmaleimide reductase